MSDLKTRERSFAGEAAPGPPFVFPIATGACTDSFSKQFTFLGDCHLCHLIRLIFKGGNHRPFTV